jgi:hypothetical protein
MDNKNPAAVPEPLPKTNSALQRLSFLTGEWDVESSSMSFHPDPSAVAHGRASFEWLEGGAFLVEHSEPDSPDFPRSISLIGPDDAAGTYCMLYYDSRGVSRVYQMSLNESSWDMWRDFPGFLQRFKGTLSGDGRSIRGHWEKSSDGQHWEHDFDLTYTKLR